jgi:hypothetical protein
VNVAELIEQLQKLPPETRVVVDGYEDGYDDIKNIETLSLHINANTVDEYYGDHADADRDYPADAVIETCVRLGK